MVDAVGRTRSKMSGACEERLCARMNDTVARAWMTPLRARELRRGARVSNAFGHA
jgi:hypothetical protein